MTPPLSAQKKEAYRQLLYQALLRIRRLAWQKASAAELLDPWSPEREEIRLCGELADCLHNLALFSALDFVHFEEKWFRRDVEQFLSKNPGPTADLLRSEVERIRNLSDDA